MSFCDRASFTCNKTKDYTTKITSRFHQNAFTMLLSLLQDWFKSGEREKKKKLKKVTLKMKILNSLNKIANLSTTLSGLGRDLLQYSDEPNLTVLSKQQMAQN